MSDKPTVEEILESLTGFDEIAIEKHMEIDPYTDAERKPIWLMRALVFVIARRGGLSDVDAKAAALSMPLKDVNDVFDDEEEANPDDPDTDSGKDDSRADDAPSDSPTSVSVQE